MSSSPPLVPSPCVSSTGVTVSHLLCADASKFEAAHPDASTVAVDPKFPGSMSEFVETVPERGRYQFRNKVKKCRKCGKPNAFTLSTCNSCGASIADIAITSTHNIFTGFICGVAKGPFPYKISMRYETEDVIVFDDLLALAPCHVNCVPTDMYIADIRVLFEAPEAGLAVVKRLADAARGVARSQFFENRAWATKFLSSGMRSEPAFVEEHAIAGFNYPPSQYQLHLQFMLPPLTPFHFAMYHAGNHYTRGRFFPLEYLIAGLELGIPIRGAGNMDMGDIVALLERHGVRYDDIYNKCYERYGKSHSRAANWDPRDFSHFSAGGAAFTRDGKLDDTVGVSDAVKCDKLSLQAYGRPYVAPGKPGGTFYSHAKDAPLPSFPCVES